VVREYDLITLGGGPAGYPAAIRAAQLGARVCLVEKGSLGGTCLNWGCIPTKTLHGLAHLLVQARRGNELGAGGSMRPDPVTLFHHKEKVVKDLVAGIEHLLKARKIDVVRGEGRVTGQHLVEVDGVGTLRGKSIIIATGSSEVSLPGIDFDGERIVNSKNILDLGRIPKSLLIIGGGAIGCEFASIFNALGTDVTVVEMLPRIIATEETQISRTLQVLFRKSGIKVYLGTKVSETAVTGDGVTSLLDNGEEVVTELVLVSVGRRPNVTGIGLEEIGAAVNRAGVQVNNRMETNVSGIYAAGDVVGGLMLAHVATREGVVAAANALGTVEEVSYKAIPSTIYTLPEVSHVGLTENEAREKGIEITTGRFPFAANGKAKGLGEEDGFVKWVVGKENGLLLGLHIIGPMATELLPAGIIAVEQEMTVDDFAASVFPHPTLSESLTEAVESARGRAIHLLH